MVYSSEHGEERKKARENWKPQRRKRPRRIVTREKGGLQEERKIERTRDSDQEEERGNQGQIGPKIPSF